MGNNQDEIELYNKNEYQSPFENSLDLKLLCGNVTTFWIPGNKI